MSINNGIKIFALSAVAVFVAAVTKAVASNKKTINYIPPSITTPGITNNANQNMIEQVSMERINGLHPKIKEKTVAFIMEAKKQGMHLRVTSGYRSFKEQQEIYNQGRTDKTKPIVSNAKPGRSWHNYGLAFDVVEIKNGKALWKNPNWEKIGKLGESFGFGWGGRFKNVKDMPHFEMKFGLTTSQALALREKHNTDYIPIV